MFALQHDLTVARLITEQPAATTPLFFLKGEPYNGKGSLLASLPACLLDCLLACLLVCSFARLLVCSLACSPCINRLTCFNCSDVVAFVHIRASFSHPSTFTKQIHVWCEAAQRHLASLDPQYSDSNAVLCTYDNLAVEQVQPGDGAQKLRVYTRLYLQGTHDGRDGEAERMHELFKSVWSTVLTFNEVWWHDDCFTLSAPDCIVSIISTFIVCCL